MLFLGAYVDLVNGHAYLVIASIESAAYTFVRGFALGRVNPQFPSNFC
jgi:hypothetical protein